MSKQTRVVLDSTDKPKAEEILETTGIKTFSQLFSLLLVNYGDHLVSALRTIPAAPPPPIAGYPPQSTVPVIAKPQREIPTQHTQMSF